MLCAPTVRRGRGMRTLLRKNIVSTSSICYLVTRNELSANTIYFGTYAEVKKIRFITVTLKIIPNIFNLLYDKVKYLPRLVSEMSFKSSNSESFQLQVCLSMYDLLVDRRH